MNILKAKVATVKIGSLEIEGLLFEDGTFGVAIPQLERLNLIPPNRSLKQLESLLGIAFQSHQKAKTVLHPKAVNTVGLVDLERILRKLDRQGNSFAQALCDDLVGLSLQQLFSDGFGIVFEAEDRQQWLKGRMESKALFWELTQAIQDSRQSVGKEINFFHYSTPMDAINRGLFGKTAKEIRAELGTPDSALNRDSYGNKSLRWLTTVQESSAFRVRRGDKPCDAIKAVIQELGYSVIDFRE